MNNFLIFSSIPIFLLLRVSMIVRMEQYISYPLSFLNPPDIFCLFFYFSQVAFWNFVIKQDIKIMLEQQMVVVVFFHSIKQYLFFCFCVFMGRIFVFSYPLAIGGMVLLFVAADFFYRKGCTALFHDAFPCFVHSAQQRNHFRWPVSSVFLRK